VAWEVILSDEDELWFKYSYPVSATANAVFGMGVSPTWDSFARKGYVAAGQALDKQSLALAQRGNVTMEELRFIVESQRNQLVLETRKRLSPFGRLYSRILKPVLPTAESLLAKKGTAEAVLRSAGKSRASVNRFAASLRMGGPATIILQITVSCVIIALADEEERNRVAAGQVGSVAGASAGGVAGAWAGCASLSALASPSLIVPFWGEVSTGSACIIGGFVGGFGGGWLFGMLGDSAGKAAYDYTTRLEWIE